MTAFWKSARSGPPAVCTIRTRALPSPLVPHERVGYDRAMKSKTFVSLDQEVVAADDAIARSGENQSQAIERPLQQGLAPRPRAALDERDRGIIDAHADELNEEALDVLDFQVERAP